MSQFQFVPPISPASAVPAPRFRRWWRWYIAAGVVVMAAVVVVGASTVYARQVYWPASPSGALVAFKIEEGTTVAQIADQLQAAHLIEQPVIFSLYVRLSGTASKLQSGGFQIPQHISIQDLVTRLQAAKRDEATLRFVEGWRREEMADYVTKQHEKGLIDMTGDQFSALALNPSPTLRAKLGTALAPGDSLQGFLFPDTYIVNRDETAEQLLGRMLDTYKKRTSSGMVAGFKKQGLNEYEGLTLAAVVERESHKGDERAIIAGILLSRLKAGIPLGVDATLQYALGYSNTEKKWWRQSLTIDDLKVDSPYNTRLHAGLPPHPICNPSLTAMQAVAQPKDTNYLYYIHDSSGQAHYARTLDEHNANIAKYLR